MVTDLKFLKDFCKNDNSRVEKYVSIYLKSTPQNLEKIGKYFKDGNHEMLKTVIHSMKPHLEYMGMSRTRDTAIEIERLIMHDAGDEELFTKVQALVFDCEQSLDELSSANL